MHPSSCCRGSAATSVLAALSSRSLARRPFVSLKRLASSTLAAAPPAVASRVLGRSQVRPLLSVTNQEEKLLAKEEEIGRLREQWER